MNNQGITRTVLKASAVIFMVSVIAKLTAFLSEVLLAAYLGLTDESDAYYMVTGIQAVLYPMLSAGVWKVFLPVYKEKITLEDHREAFSLTNQGITFFTLISLGAVILLELFAGLVVSLVAPGFTGEKRALCIELLRISAPMYVFILAASIYSALLQCHNRFFGSQIREVVSHIPTILAAVFLYQRFGIRVFAAALVVGGLARLLIELPFVNWGYRYRPDFRFRSADFDRMLKRLPFALISEGVTQLNVLVDKIMASLLPKGTVSGLNYAHRLINVLSGLISTSVATALYPQMVELISKKEKEALSNLLLRIIELFAFLMLPVTLAAVLFRGEIVAVIYQHGNFTAENTALTSGIFAFYALGLFFIACNEIIFNLFYGNGDTKTPMYISLINLGVNVVLNLALIQLLGANGLALATSLSAAVSFCVRLWAARRYCTFNYRALFGSTLKVLCVAALAIVPAWFGLRALGVGKLLTLLLAVVVCVPLYLLLAKLFRMPELHMLTSILHRKKK